MPREQRKIPWLVLRNGVYYVMWYDAVFGQTKRQSLRTGDAAEAQARFAMFLAEGGDRIQNAAGKITVQGALSDYIRERGPQVADPQRIKHAAQHLIAHYGATAIAEVDIPSSRGYAEWRRGHLGKGQEGLSDSTIRRELVVLRAAANHARKWRRLGAHEMPSIELPREPRRDEVWLSKAELERVIATAGGQLKDFILIAYYTGARRASVEQLTRAQIDLRAGRINLTSGHETQAQRHSKKRRPVVPIHPRIRPVIERLMDVNRDSVYLFGNCYDMYPRFHAHLIELGLPAKAYPHILRHSRATHLLEDGVNIYDVAKLLGDTISTVEKTYGHHSVDHLAATLGSVG